MRQEQTPFSRIVNKNGKRKIDQSQEETISEKEKIFDTYAEPDCTIVA